MLTPNSSVNALAGTARISWLIVLVTVVTVGIFARLGFWQLSRANEKIAILQAAQEADLQPPLQNLERIDGTDVYRQVELTGYFDLDRQFLRDNVVLNNRPGYEVLTPFYYKYSDGVEAERAILVNRGWVSLGVDRKQLPTLEPLVSDDDLPLRIVGILAQPSKGFTLGEAIHPAQQNWPLVTQYLDYEALSERLDTIPLLPAMVILEKGHRLGLSYSWQPVANGPEKHYGYAFQWFAMLLAVVILFIYLNFIKKHEPDGT